MLDAAHAYLSAGYRPTPLTGKRPTLRDWVNASPKTTAEIDAMAWRNVGLLMGGGLVAVDIDGPEGVETLNGLQAQHGKLPMTLTSRTGRAEGDGYHAIYEVPVDVDVRNRKLGSKLETRGQGGQIVVAPSVHPESGRAYEWVRRVAPAMAPRWLIDLLVDRPSPRPTPPPTRDISDSQRYIRASAYVAKMPPAISGCNGHDALWRVALACRGFGLSETDAYFLIASEYNHRCDPPWSDRELQHKITQAMKASRVPENYLLDERRVA